MIAASIDDYRCLAQKRLPRFLFDYIDGGSYAEQTLRRNTADMAQLALRQRVLRDASQLDLSVSLFGSRLNMPVILGPIGLAGMNARRGEVQANRAAAQAGIPFCLSTVGLCSIDEVAAASATPFWFQLYMIKDRPFMRDLLQKATACRCPVLVFTVDMPQPGSRYRDVRSGLSGASGFRGALRRFGQALVRPRWCWDVGLWGRPYRLGSIAPVLGKKSGLEDFLGWMSQNFDPSITWKDLDWIRDIWKGPLVIKGVLDADDARAAADLGAEGIIVSNHGGRQLDGVVSTVKALPRIAEAVGDRLVVLADGGVRSGLDVVRLLSLGARGVCLGRAWAYGLAARGERGVREVLDIVRNEMRIAMALTGASRPSDLGAQTLEKA